MLDAAALDKRKRSDEGLLGLLGTYASDTEEEDSGQSPKRLKSTEEPVESVRAQSEEALADITLALNAAAQRLGNQQPVDLDTSPQRADPMDGEAGAATAEEDESLYDLPAELAERPLEPCAQEVQDKVTDYIVKQDAAGQTISNRLRGLSGYRNPDFLHHCVVYENISEYGTCYPPAIFDPTNLPPEDYYDRLAAEWQQHNERQRAERSKTQKVDFVKGAPESGGRAPPAGLSAQSVAANLVAAAKAGQRASKWDAKR